MRTTIDELREYLSKRYKISPSEISENTSILNDLEIKGDDVDEFISILIKDFSINVGVIDLNRFHVGEEPFDLISALSKLFQKNRSEKPTILIRDILTFIETGNLK